MERPVTWFSNAAILLVAKQFESEPLDIGKENIEAIRIWKQHTGKWKSGSIEIIVGERKDGLFYLEPNGEFPIVSDGSSIIHIDSSSGNVQTNKRLHSFREWIT